MGVAQPQVQTSREAPVVDGPLTPPLAAAMP
jgi:hypothetical protein